MNMRPLWRSLLLVFVLWFALCPTLCFASETVTSSTYSLRDEGISTFSIKDSEITNGYLDVNLSLVSFSDGVPRYVFNKVSLGSYLPPFTYSTGTSLNSTMHEIWETSSGDIHLQFFLKDNTGDKIFKKNDVVSIHLTGLFAAYHNQYSWSIVNYGGGTTNHAEPFDLSKIKSVQLSFSDLTSEVWSGDVKDCLTIDGDTFGISLTDYSIPIDTNQISMVFVFDGSADDLNSNISGFNRWNDAGVYEIRFVDSTLSMEIEDSSTGLLNGIISWLKSIRDGILNVGNGVTNVFNSILELPAKLWNLIETGLKNLFVPSETAIAQMKDKWDTLLADRFGVVYESGALVIDIANSVSEASTSETITFPSVSYNFSGTEFTFGGYEVDVIPNGFEFLADILKGVLDIVCTLAFINAMRRKYDELMMR